MRTQSKRRLLVILGILSVVTIVGLTVLAVWALFKLEKEFNRQQTEPARISLEERRKQKRSNETVQTNMVVVSPESDVATSVAV